MFFLLFVLALVGLARFEQPVFFAGVLAPGERLRGTSIAAFDMYSGLALVAVDSFCFALDMDMLFVLFLQLLISVEGYDVARMVCEDRGMFVIFLVRIVGVFNRICSLVEGGVRSFPEEFVLVEKP